MDTKAVNTLWWSVIFLFCLATLLCSIMCVVVLLHYMYVHFHTHELFLALTTC